VAFGISILLTVMLSPFISPLNTTLCPAWDLSAARSWLAI